MKTLTYNHVMIYARAWLLHGVEDTGHVKTKHRPTNLLSLFSTLFWPFVLCCSAFVTVSSTPSKSESQKIFLPRFLGDSRKYPYSTTDSMNKFVNVQYSTL